MAATHDAIDEMTAESDKEEENSTSDRGRSALTRAMSSGSVGWVPTTDAGRDDASSVSGAEVATETDSGWTAVDDDPVASDAAVVDDPVVSDAADVDEEDGANPDASVSSEAEEPTTPSPRRPRRVAVALFVVPLLLVGALVGAGVFAWRAHDSATAAASVNDQREAYLQAGRQAALYLSTIRVDSVDSDVARILGATGDPFRADFASRADSFKSVVREAKSTSIGQLAGAGVQSFDGNQASILVALNVTTSNAGGKDQDPKSWRMKVTVNRIDGKLLATSVEFVP